MKMFRCAILFLAVAVGTSQAAERFPIVTVNGANYYDVTFGPVTPVTIVSGTVIPAIVKATHRSGVATFPLDVLPPDVQKRLGYDPASYREAVAAVVAAKAKAAADARAEAEAAKIREAEAAKQAEQEAAARAAAEKAAQEKAEADRAAAAELTRRREIESLRGTRDYLDARYGFRDLKFGQSMAECKGMRAVPTQRFLYTEIERKHIQTGRREGDEMKVGAATVESIEYTFYKDKLMAVQIHANGFRNYTGMKEACEALYGFASPNGSDDVQAGEFGKKGAANVAPEAKSQMVVWNGERATVYLYYHKSDDDVGLRVSSREIEAQKNADIEAPLKAEIDAEKKAKANEKTKGL
jgi:hypothetical protein